MSLYGRAERTHRRLRLSGNSYYVGDRLEGNKPGDYAVLDLVDRLGPPRNVPEQTHIEAHRWVTWMIVALFLNLAVIAAYAIWR